PAPAGPLHPRGGGMGVNERDDVEVNVDGGRWSVRLYRQAGGGWSACERDLVRAGLELPVSQRAAWLATGQTQWLLGAHDTSGRCRAALGLRVQGTRAMPGHRLIRAEKVGLAARDLDAVRALLSGIERLVAREPRVLRVEVALFQPD